MCKVNIQGAAHLAMICAAASDNLSDYCKFLHFKKVLIALRRYGIGKTLGEVGFTTHSTEIRVIREPVIINECTRVVQGTCLAKFMHDLLHFLYLWWGGGRMLA